MTQSENASAKVALIIAEVDIQHLKQNTKRNIDWNRIGYRNMFTSQKVIAFHDHAFYFRMLKKTIDSMIDTGQMDNLVKISYKRNLQSFGVTYNGPKVLAMSDLEFGFLIWVGCCCVSIIGFMIEQLFRLVKKTKHVALPVDRPISNVGTRYRSDQGEVENKQDQSEDIDQEETEVDEMRQNQSQSSQNQDLENVNQNIDTRSKPEGRNMEVHAEVHEADEMEESLLYFEAIIDSNERQKSGY